jgi:hypothetical protein
MRLPCKSAWDFWSRAHSFGRTAICSSLCSPVTNQHGPTWAEGEENNTDARLWHPWLRINRVLRVMLQTRWSAEDVIRSQGRIQEGARAPQRDAARGVV